MMDRKRTFQKLEQIYARRRKIETARKSVLDQQLTEEISTVAAMEQHRKITETAHADEVKEVLGTAHKAVHYNTMLSALAAKKVRHHDEMTLLRFNILRKRDDREKAKARLLDQQDITRNANRRAEKMKLLLEREDVAQNAAQDVSEEEETAEAQAAGQARHA